MRQVILEVPFTFIAQVVPPRKRNAQPVKVADTVAVHMRVADPEEMPVAFRVMDLSAMIAAERGEGDKATILIRWDGKRTMRAIQLNQEPERLDEADLQDTLTLGSRLPFSTRYYNLAAERMLVAVARDAVIGNVLSDDEAAERARIILAAQKIIFCDGSFWGPCGEPIWEKTGGFRSESVSVKIVNHSDLASFGNNHFRADNLKQALGIFPENKAVNLLGKIEILIPEALGLPVEEACFLGMARRCISADADKVAKMPVPSMVVYGNLRDSLPRSAGDYLVTNNIALACEAYLAGREDGTRGTNGQNMLDTALARWNDHAARADHGPVSLPAPT